MNKAPRSWIPFWARSITPSPASVSRKQDIERGPCHECVESAKNLLWIDAKMDADEEAESRMTWNLLDTLFNKHNCGSSSEYQMEIYNEELAMGAHLRGFGP